MDPNETLRQLRKQAEIAHNITPAAPANDPLASSLEAIVELVDALDAWLSGGGFLPDAWSSR